MAARASVGVHPVEVESWLTHALHVTSLPEPDEDGALLPERELGLPGHHGGEGRIGLGLAGKAPGQQIGERASYAYGNDSLVGSGEGSDDRRQLGTGGSWRDWPGGFGVEVDGLGNGVDLLGSITVGAPSVPTR